MKLASKIEELLSKEASDLEISKYLKEYIKNYFSNIESLFEKYQGKEFLVRHTKYTDSIIIAIYKVAIRKLFNFYTPLSNNIPITLVALGSYGREQLAPYSDIDLMIVYENVEGYNIKEIIQKILYIIWDSGLKLGHRVHELQELPKIAKEDITIKTALIESRYITGSKFLWFKIENSLNEIRKDNIKEFIEEKLTEAKQRYKKYPLSMEPNIKEGVGSLRDSNLLFWIANSIYGVKSLKDLSSKIFSEEEYKEYRIALEWLFKVRVALHIAAKKKEDRLLLQYIPDVANLLDIKVKDSKKKQQTLITKTLHAMHTIHNFSTIFTKKLYRPYIYNPKNFPTIRKNRLSKNVVLCNKSLYASYFEKEYPIKRLYKIFLENEFEVCDPSFIYFAKKAKYSKNPLKTVKNLYFKENLYPILKLLYNANLITAFAPPFKKVLFMPQFDGYHKYPVVIHSIKSVKALENIKDEFIKELFNQLTSEEKALLKAATLLHDSGKGRRQSHHEVGAKLFKSYATKIGFSEKLVKIGENLIKHHTCMTQTAYNKDIYNEKVIYSFLAPLKSKKVLDMLYILTYADINGVGRDIYTPYNAQLLRTLYKLSLEALEKKEILDETQKRLKKENALKKSKEFQKLPKILQKKILSIESNLFFIKHSISEILEISKIAFETEKYNYKIENDEFLTIKIIRKIPLNLGFLLGKLLFLDIASMGVFKLFDNIKYFKIEFREKIDKNDLKFIEEIVKESFNMEAKINLKKPIIQQDEIKLNCEHSKSYAQLIINAKDQKGLLAYIAKIFDDYGIDIATAKIHTMKNRVNDLFLIEKKEDICKKIDTILKKLTGD